MRKLLIFLLVLSLNQVIGQSVISEIQLERTTCNGACPAYLIQIKSNGDVIFKGKKNAIFDGFIKGKLSTTEWTRLKNKYSKKAFLTLPNNYKIKTYDVSKIHYSIVVNKKRKQIRNADEGPQYLADLANDISYLISKKIKWNKSSFKENPQIQNKSELGFDSSIEEVQAEEFVESPTVEMPAEKRIEEIEPRQESVFSYVEQMPEFPGGLDALMTFIRTRIQYPRLAIESGISGKVICGFIVNTDGSISDAKVLRGIGGGCDEEAIRVIKSMPNFKPGTQNGHPVRVRYNLPINFNLK
jgi:TonB family protein